MARLVQVTPFVLCSNKQVTIALFETVLGLRCTFSTEN
jgi:hypothetical protein